MRFSSFSRFLIFILFLILTPSTVFSWSVKFVSVSDGDTIKDLHSGIEETVRLYGIDTPEKKQEID